MALPIIKASLLGAVAQTKDLNDQQVDESWLGVLTQARRARWQS
jgi:hypothetical protein